MKPLSVLHLLEPAVGEEAVMACRAAMAIPGVDHALWLIGTDADERFAAAREVRSGDRIVPTIGVAELAFRRASNLFERRYWRPDAPLPTPDLIMCWSKGAMGLSRLIVGKRGVMRCGVLLKERRTLRPGGWPFRRESFALADVTTVAVSERIRDVHARAASVGRGLTFLKDNIRLFDPPAAETAARGAETSRRRAELRNALGVPSDHRLIVLLADPPSDGDAKRFTFLLGLLFAGHQRVSGIVPVGAARLGRASRYLREHDRRWGLIVSDWPLEKRLAAADAAVVLPTELGANDRSAPSCGPTSVAAALGAGVPVFSTDDTVPRSLLDGGRSASETSTPDGERLSERCLATDFGHDGLLNRVAGLMAPALRSDETLEGLRARSIARAEEIRRDDSFRRDLLALWMEIANVPIVRPGLPVPPALRERENGDAPMPLSRTQSVPA